MTAQEVSVPYVIEDFELGDGVWYFDAGRNELLLGDITEIRGNYLYATCNDGRTYYIKISEFGKRSLGGEAWGRTLDISLLHKGSILSRVVNGKRIFERVEQFRNYKSGYPGTITLRSMTGTEEESDTCEFRDKYELHKLLREWEL